MEALETHLLCHLVLPLLARMLRLWNSKLQHGLYNLFYEESSLYSPFDSLIHWVTTGWGIKRQIMTMPSWRWEWRREGQHYRYLKASIFIKVMLWPILWSPNAKSRLIGKDPDSGKDWRQKEKRLTEDGMWMASLMQWTWTWENSRR